MEISIPLSSLPLGFAFWLPVVFLVGAMFGSFMNVVIYRLPIMAQRRAAGVISPPFNLAIPRSRCPECGHQIAGWDNIPVLSWMILGGRCRACKAPIHWRYPMVELVVGVVFVVVVVKYSLSWTALATLTAICLCVVWAGLVEGKFKHVRKA